MADGLSDNLKLVDDEYQKDAHTEGLMGAGGTRFMTFEVTKATPIG